MSARDRGMRRCFLKILREKKDTDISHVNSNRLTNKFQNNLNDSNQKKQPKSMQKWVSLF
jgi:hypothetical protein